MEKNECVHELTDKNTTLVKLAKQCMAYPPVEFYICKCCKKGFNFTKDEKGNSALVR